ncbi:MAG: EamA family transporter [Rhodospirillales bacterium]|nr:EamA family transporter [Rhodospirillales bacterium]
MHPRDIAAAAAIVLLWSVNFSANKIAVGQFPPVMMVAMRFALIGAMLAPLLRPTGKPFWRIALIAFTLGGLHFGLFFSGLKGIGAGMSAIVTQLAVPFSAVLAAVFFRERTGLPQVAGMALAFAGIYVIVGEPTLEFDALHLGLAVASALAFAAANIQIKLLGPVNGFVLNAWIAVLAAPQLAIVSLIGEEDQFAALAAADWRGWSAMIFTTVSGGVVAYGLWYYLLGRYAVNRIVPLTLMAPAFAILIAGVVLNEPLTWKVLAGTALTLIGVAAIQLRQASSRKPGRRCDAKRDRS